MQATAIIEVLSRALPADATRFEVVESRDGMPTFYAPLDLLVDACRVLRDAPELRFVFLADVTAVDYHPRDPRYELLYILACPGVAGYGDTPKRLRLKVRVAEAASVPSVSSVWQAANWGEREVYDFFGLHFDGTSGHAPHPDARGLGRLPDAERLPGADQSAGEDLRTPAGHGGRVRREHGGGAAAGTAGLMPSSDIGGAVSIVGRTLDAAIDAHRRVRGLDLTAVATAASTITSALGSGRKLLAFGNGGSAGDAQHLVAELVGRFQKERPGFAAVALTADTSLLTSVANDYGFEQVFARQVNALGVAGDVAFAISTSGASPNVLAALEAARARGLRTIALTGRDGGEAGRLAEVHINVPDDCTARVQEVHITLIHAICEIVEMV